MEPSRYGLYGCKRVANDLNFVRRPLMPTHVQTCTANLAGYQAVTVAAIEYSWTGTSSTSTADFRYDFHDLTLSDAAGNADTIP